MPIPSTLARSAAAARSVALCLLLLAALLLGACADDEQGPLEIAGTYTDQYGSTHTINNTTWTDSFVGSFNIAGYSNGENYLIAQNSTSNSFNAGLYSRFSWTTSNSDLYYCQSPYNASTYTEALSTAEPDRSSPATGGCDQFSWTNLTP